MMECQHYCVTRVITSRVEWTSSASSTSVDKNGKTRALESCLRRALPWIRMTVSVYRYFCFCASLMALLKKSRMPPRNILVRRLQERGLTSLIPQAHPPQESISPHSKKKNSEYYFQFLVNPSGIHVNTGSPDRLVAILQPKSGVESTISLPGLPVSLEQLWQQCWAPLLRERIRDLVAS